ncbi:MAG: hypothetical protein RMA76_37475 [Deltaproteobacteria bacterium]|jgi:hypothetical protein
MQPTTNRLARGAAALLPKIAEVTTSVRQAVEPRTAAPVEVPENEARRAVADFVRVVESDRLQAYYDAAIGVGDPELKATALALFDRLPSFDATARAEDFVAAGLWTAAPRGNDAMQASPRYPVGRQVRIATNIVVPEKGDANAYAYDRKGPVGVTFRATIVGAKDDAYLVAVDGRDAPLEVDKASVHELNDPEVVADGRHHWMRADFDDPLLKAKVCEAALAVAPHAARLDFRRDTGMASGGRWHQVLGKRASSASTEAIQHDAVRAVYSVLDVKRPTGAAFREPGRYMASDVGRMAVKGAATSHKHATTMAALLAPFGPSLGLDVVAILGGVHRHARASDPERRLRQLRMAATGWLEVTTRPSGNTVVSDPGWDQPIIARERAYAPDGDRYPTRPLRLRGALV